MEQNNRNTMGNNVSKQVLNGETPLAKGLGVFELTEGMNVEEMRSIFFNHDALREPEVRLYQLNSKSHRYYYYFGQDGRPVFMPSVTTILSHVMPENQFLTSWKLSMGAEKAASYTAERAAYGTFMHACIEQLIINRTYDLDALKGELAKYIEREKLPSSFIAYADDVRRDLLAFAQFMYDYDIQPYAVEIALYHPELGYAGMIDLVANIRELPRSDQDKAIAKLQAKIEAAGDDEKKLAKCAEERAAIEAKYAKRLNAIIDFKSGRKGFYEEHEIQLGMYKPMWESWFPEVEIEGLFNWSPKDWRKAPDYNFKNQSESKNLVKIPALLELYKLEGGETKEVTVVGGVIDLNNPGTITGCVNTVSLEELVKAKNQRPEEEPEDDTPLFPDPEDGTPLFPCSE